MDNLYNTLRSKLEGKLVFLDDKPEENIDTTLCSLWHKAAGNSISAKKVNEHRLPKLSENQIALLDELIEERLQGKPLAHITERQNFMGIEFICDNRALIPRQETEILAKAALNYCKQMCQTQSHLRILDLCCGSGNVGLSLAKYIDNVSVYSSDLSSQAVELTKDNIEFLNLQNKVKVVISDLFEKFEAAEYYNNIDLIVCNPPYISSAKVAKMNSEIAENEPLMAFDGGMMGLKIIQKLIGESPKFLRNEGLVIFELGVGQGPFLLKILESNSDYTSIETFCDEKGNIRTIAAQHIIQIANN